LLERKLLGMQNGLEYAEGFIVDVPMKIDSELFFRI
jgi:hypothetical protein